jgi:endonuclease/exonuclease/phosphatase (EEP) superfamily protein YafD
MEGTFFQQQHSLDDNLKRLVYLALGAQPYTTLSRVIVSGDFNRQDWNRTRLMRLVSVQRAKAPKKTISGMAYDNVLYSPRDFLHTLELTDFRVGPMVGSDHRIVEAKFRAQTSALK